MKLQIIFLFVYKNKTFIFFYLIIIMHTCIFLDVFFNDKYCFRKRNLLMRKELEDAAKDMKVLNLDAIPADGHTLQRSQVPSKPAVFFVSLIFIFLLHFIRIYYICMTILYFYLCYFNYVMYYDAICTLGF